MKALIIDNEAPLRQGMLSLLREYCPEITEMEEADGVHSGLQKIRNYHPDIVFLDVEMEDGSGFDLMKQIPDPDFQLIFVTAHNKYAIEAFRFSAIDYLLKPVDPESLQISVQKASKNIRHSNLSQQVQILLQQLAGIHNQDKKIVLKDIENTYFIRVSDICYCEAEGTYTKFFIQQSPAILVSKNLKEYESILEPLGFLRTHHSFLVNPDKIKMYDKTDGGSLILDGGYSVPVSQRKKDFVMQVLEKR
ncbi:MAG: LytTR family DNA-binding domain-containing protein [Bacteroidetes bacterium]|nr:LytTR family DNA-binding domain-containing protein [Bacteroidota bacterium]